MKIYSMTATFGKLDHETLTLKPGLNVISASNEWGKSTWCAFLVAMLYGLETRSKSTKTTLADKEHYAPWSGRPMEGRIDLNWQGRDITIERRTRGRIPLGEFRAYETASGLEVPELDGTNCGQKLLGVERSVFLRSGFIRNDLSVTDDEALRRRLNNLVTTGDENSAADRLARGLKDLKNKVRYNRTGLLPQAEAERDRLEKACRDLSELDAQANKALRRLDELEDWRMALENHRTALAWTAAREDERKVAQARQRRDEARIRVEDAAALCEPLPQRETARELLQEIDRLQGNLTDLELRLQGLIPPSEEPVESPCFAGMTGEAACHRAKEDMDRHWDLMQHRWLLLIFGLVLVCAGIFAARWFRLPGLVCAGVGVLVLAADMLVRVLRRGKARKLEAHYASDDPDRWMRMAEDYAAALHRQSQGREDYLRERQLLEQQLKELDGNILEATQNQGLENCRADWEDVLRAWDAHAEAVRELRQAEAHLEDLCSLLRPAEEPQFPDRMDYSEADTARLLSDCYAERRKLENLLGQCQGRRAGFEPAEVLAQKLEQADNRVRQLEQTYEALVIAQETLAEAAGELQRRFAPRISRRAGELMRTMTGGRYDRLTLDEDLAIRAGARQEDTLRETLWRSDGTVDQLYMALRLAVAEVLLPQAPLILDDALVRFDDQRLKAAMEILKTEAENRQVIVFSCHSREKNLL